MANSGIKLYRRISVMAVLFFVLSLMSCYSPEEGCLDPEATNYSITGDNDCEDCCTYPELSISIFHESMDTTFSLLDTITNDLGQQVSLVDFVYLLSDFKLSIDGSTIEVEDSVSVETSDGSIYVKDDVIRVSRSTFTYDIGTLIYNGTIDGISFKIGLVDVLNENSFTTEIEDHPLTTDPDSLFNEASNTYVFQRIKLAQGEDFLDTIIYDIETPFERSFAIDFTSIRGEDKNIIIEAQYDKWFEGIDFESMTTVEIADQIGQNSVNLLRNKQ